MIDIKVYNAEQIGGCFTVITTAKAKIMIDYGLPLPGAKAEQEDFDWEHDTVDAVFITHYHGDHVGKILDIPAPIPIYMGSGTKEIMLNIHKALVRVPKFKEEQQRWIELLKGNRIREVQENTPINEIEGITVTPYSVDHSAYDAYMYLIEADGKTILHTGDFRGHGYRGSKMLGAIQDYVHENGRKVDYLITEGTMMGDRRREKVKTEEEMREEATKLFRENRYVFLVISSTNLDSLASFYMAAAENKMRMYCYNYYFYNQLKTFARMAGSENPEYQFENIYTVDFEKQLSHECWEEDKTQEELMREHGFLCVMKADARYHEWIERFQDKNPLVIYSMWDGYISQKTGKEAYNKEWADFFAPYKESKQFRDLHTSGHATAQMIAEVIQAVDPKEAIIPMHTENVKGFKELAIHKRYQKIIQERGEFHSMDDVLVCKNVIDGILKKQDDKSSFFISPNNTGRGFTVYAYGGDIFSVSALAGKIDKIDLYDGIRKYTKTGHEIYGYHDYMEDGQEIYKHYAELNRKDVNAVIAFYNEYWNSIVQGVHNWAMSNCIRRKVNYPHYERMRETKIAANNNRFSEKRIAIIAMEWAIDVDGKTAKPDMIGVYVRNGQLVFQYIEYKCTPKGNGNKSAPLKKHFQDMSEYVDSLALKQKVLEYLQQMLELGYIEADENLRQMVRTVNATEIETELGFWFSHMKRIRSKAPDGNEKGYVSEEGLRKKYDEMKSYRKENASKYAYVEKRLKFLFLENENEIVEVEKMLPTVSEWDASKNRL